MGGIVPIHRGVRILCAGPCSHLEVVRVRKPGGHEVASRGVIDGNHHAPLVVEEDAMRSAEVARAPVLLDAQLLDGGSLPDDVHRPERQLSEEIIEPSLFELAYGFLHGLVADSD